MAYMSYCRFEGTLNEMRACIADVYEHVNEEAEYKVSAREIDCFRSMVEEMAEFISTNELMDEYGEIDEDRLDEICEAMGKDYGNEDWD